MTELKSLQEQIRTSQTLTVMDLLTELKSLQELIRLRQTLTMTVTQTEPRLLRDLILQMLTAFLDFQHLSRSTTSKVSHQLRLTAASMTTLQQQAETSHSLTKVHHLDHLQVLQLA